ncbi:MAG: hypothetical protein R8J94_04765 [Acidimicrobiia bacterium]|nr:hypothetical protein [Acidimicrobiia bacterium]
MRRLSSGSLISAALVAGFLTTASLVLPWFTIAGKSRSSVDLLSSASALDVIEGGVKVAVIGGWLLAPVLVAAAMLLAASGRHRLAAGLLVPVVASTLLVVAIGLAVDAVDLAWGAFVGAVFALLASACAIMVLATPRTDT